MRGTRALADETGALITIHVAETDFEIAQSQARFQCTDTEYLSDIGLLGPDVLAVHCVQCSNRDIRALRQHDVKVSHNPCSNMYLASGVPPIPAMLAAGLTVGLGSDGPASSNNHSLFQAMKMAALIQKGSHRDPTIVTAEKALEMATIDGARAIGLGHEIGSIEVGKKADIAVVGTDHPAMAPMHNRFRPWSIRRSAMKSRTCSSTAGRSCGPAGSSRSTKPLCWPAPGPPPTASPGGPGATDSRRAHGARRRSDLCRWSTAITTGFRVTAVCAGPTAPIAVLSRHNAIGTG